MIQSPCFCTHFITFLIICNRSKNAVFSRFLLVWTLFIYFQTFCPLMCWLMQGQGWQYSMRMRYVLKRILYTLYTFVCLIQSAVLCCKFYKSDPKRYSLLTYNFCFDPRLDWLVVFYIISWQLAQVYKHSGKNIVIYLRFPKLLNFCYCFFLYVIYKCI